MSEEADRLTVRARAIIDFLSDAQKANARDEVWGWWAADLDLAEYEETYNPETGDEVGFFATTRLGRRVAQLLGG